MNTIKSTKLVITMLISTFSCLSLTLAACSDSSLTNVTTKVSPKVNDQSTSLESSKGVDSSTSISTLGAWTEKDTNMFMLNCSAKVSNENTNFDANTVNFLCSCAFNLIQPVYLPKEPFVLDPNDEQVIQRTCLAQAGISVPSSSSGSSASETDKCSGLEYSDELLCRGVPAHLIP